MENFYIGYIRYVTPGSASEGNAFSAFSSGYVNNQYDDVNLSYGVRPVLYLKSNVKFTGDGDGTENNKYQLTIDDAEPDTPSDTTPPTLTFEEENGSVTITASDDVGLSEENTYEYYLSTSNTQLTGGEWTTYTSGQSFTITGSGDIYIWVYPVKDTSGNVNDNKTYGEPYVIGMVTIEETPSGTGALQTLTNLVPNENDVVTTGDGQLINLGDYGIRYQGTDPNNYVEFSGETWRIIGIVDGKVKLIRDESIGKMAWNDQDGDGSNDSGIDINNWSEATLQTYLNGDYYNSLTDKDMIDTSTWYLRGYNTTTGIDKYEMYGIERGTGSIAGVVMHDTPSIERNVGIMYPSDYGFAAQVTDTCTDDKYLYRYEPCKDTNWIANTQTTSYEWLITPNSDREYYAFIANSSGYVYNSSNVYASYVGVRPVLYLKSNVKFTGDGDGTENNKYQLTME